MANTAGALAGQVAVVTGGGRGIGAAIAQKLASLGAWVAVCGRTKEMLEDTVQAISAKGYGAEAIVCDVQQARSVEQVAQAVSSLSSLVGVRRGRTLRT